ncbi:MAG TPA: hypothetical protein VF931_10030 [Steroidobacteraceae bacterium]
MSRLVLVLPDLYPTRLSEAARAALPRLPALERWFRQGRPEGSTAGWRHWLQREWHGGALASAMPASIAGAAVAGVPTDQPLWLASPVHFVAGLDTLRLHPAGLLHLDAAEQRELVSDFLAVFAGSGWSLHATGRREMLVSGGAPVALRSHDPGLWLGADPAEGLPAGAGAGPLRQFGAELEMRLHEHPVNQARLARGLLNVNALWLWGGGAPLAPRPPASTRAVAWAADLFVDGLCALAGTVAESLPPRWPHGKGAPTDLLTVCEWGADADALAALERDWIAPALEQWRGGVYQSATLLAGIHAVSLERAPLRRLWRAWRRPRPWWESLLQC